MTEHDHSHDHDHDHGHDHDHDHDHGHDHDHDHDHGPSAEEFERAQAEAVRRRALQQIRQYPDPALRLRANEVEIFDEALMNLVERMIGLMKDAGGVGLAATQVGILQRVFVFEPDEDGPKAIVNPVLSNVGSDKDTDEEGCLSLQHVRVDVERPTKLTLSGKDPEGNDVTYDLEGYGARVVQHELDHLDGMLIIDRTDAASRKEALGTLRPRPVLTEPVLPR